MPPRGRRLSTSALRYEPPDVLSQPQEAPPARARRDPADWLVLLATLLVAGTYVLWHLRRGLIPHDDGAIGHAAQRVLQGELPHRDFDDIYTGGLAWLNAAGFRLFGTSFLTMRLVLLGAFLVWLPAQYWIARRFVGPLAAGAVTLLAAAWSVPNYPAPMPSWFNLFLATIGVAALLRWLDGREARWLVAAGLAGGLSVLVKVIGLYYVAGVLLFLVYEAHQQSREGAGTSPARGTAYMAFVVTALVLFAMALLGLVSRQRLPAELVHFVMPGALLAALLATNELAHPAGGSARRLRILARVIGPFLLGVALPLVLFLVPYVRSGAVGALVHGVFVLPTRRFGPASIPMLPLASMLAVLPLVALAVAGRRWHQSIPRAAVLALGALLAAFAWFTAPHEASYRFVWASVRNLLPVLIVVGAIMLVRESRGETEGARRRSQLMLMMSVTAMCSLVQFPFAASIYFCYVAPLLALLATAVYASLRPMSPAIPALVVAFYLAFVVTRVNTSTVFLMGIRHNPYPATVPLALARGGVSLKEERRREYQAVERMLRTKARGGYTWASPDAPEIYFLTGLRNPTRSLFEFFDEPDGQRERVLAALEAKGVTAIVVNRLPEFSRPIDSAMHRELARRYPWAMDAGKFEVRWR